MLIKLTIALNMHLHLIYCLRRAAIKVYATFYVVIVTKAHLAHIYRLFSILVGFEKKLKYLRKYSTLCSEKSFSFYRIHIACFWTWPLVFLDLHVKLKKYDTQEMKLWSFSLRILYTLRLLLSRGEKQKPPKAKTHQLKHWGYPV